VREFHVAVGLHAGRLQAFGGLELLLQVALSAGYAEGVLALILAEGLGARLTVQCVIADSTVPSVGVTMACLHFWEVRHESGVKRYSQFVAQD